MKFLFTQTVLLITSVTLLLYLINLDYFLPYDSDINRNWYNISAILIFLFVSIQSLVSLTIFLGQKFLAFSWSEFPHHRVAFKWGIVFAVSLIGGIFLNIFDILIFPWGALAILLVIIILTVI